LVGTMGNRGVIEPYVESGDHHLHYQLKDPVGRRLNPQAFWEEQGPIDPNPAPPVYIDDHRQYLRDAGAVPATSRADVRVLRRMPARRPGGSAFDSEPVPVPNTGPTSTLPPTAQRQFGGLFGLWSPFSENPVSPDLSQTRQGQPDTPNDEDWSAMWRRRIGLP
jgi:hypothetical protein